MKRTIVAAIIAITALVAAAQVKFTQDGLKYTVIEDNCVKVEKIDDNHKPKGRLEIPKVVKYDGVKYTVTTIDSWGFFGCDEIVEVKLPPTLKKIDIWSFCRCAKLKKIDIPASVTEIGYAAFENCESFTSFTLPKGFKTVPERLLQECKNLKTVNLPASVTTILGSSFSQCESLESIVLPSALKTIGNYAFSSCKNLKELVLPKGLESIGMNAFSNCKSLKSITLPEGLIKLAADAFGCCSALEHVSLPSTLDSISGNPFSSCDALKTYDVSPANHSFTVVDGILFSKDMTELIACPIGKELGDYVVPDQVKYIHSLAFYRCDNLTSVKMTNVVGIGASAFNDCKNLANVDFGTKLENLGKAAFYSNPMIEHIILPDSFKHMDMINFEFCSSLKTVSLTEELSKREWDFNNQSFNFNSSYLRFIIRMPDGTTKMLTHDEIPDVKKYYRNR